MTSQLSYKYSKRRPVVVSLEGSAIEAGRHRSVGQAYRIPKLTSYVSILSMSGPDIERATGLSTADVSILHRAVAEAIPLSSCKTGLELSQRTPANRLSLGCPVLNEFLQGGILQTGITEVAGESACGKTQLCMQLCLTVQLPQSHGGLGCGALYICTEDVFPNKRLCQMTHYFRKAHDDSVMKKLAIMDNIFIEHAADLEDLGFCIMQKAPVLLSRGAARLIVVDSIAALFRCDFSLGESVRRAKEISAFGMQLHRLSHKFSVPVVCVNQVSAVVGDQGKGTGIGDGEKVKPSLGLCWANLVTTRLMLSRKSGEVFSSIGAPGCPGTDNSLPARTLEVVFAPHLPNSKCDFIVHSGGVSGVS